MNEFEDGNHIAHAHAVTGKEDLYYPPGEQPRGALDVLSDGLHKIADLGWLGVKTLVLGVDSRYGDYIDRHLGVDHTQKVPRNPYGERKD